MESTLEEQLQLARQEAAYYRKLAQECGERRLRESEELSHLIEQLRHTELVLKQARDDAEAANRAKSQFLATMSHELRTPLTAIIGYSQMMEQLVEAGDYSTVASNLHHVYSAGRHLLSLINDVLDISRIEAGSLHVAAERVDIPSLVNEVVSTIKPIIEQNHNTLYVSCPQHMMMMYTDPLKVRQSLLNLLGNASKFTESGEIRLTVTHEHIDGVDWIAFAVADNGIGITAEQLPKLFKTFSQIDDSLNRRYGGTGLGLTLSQRLCHLLGGDIKVESTFGVGSVFTMRLPVIVPSDANLAADRSPSLPRPAEALPNEKPPIISEQVVLLIDDSLEVGSLVGQLIAPEQACVVHATSAADGLELARDILPDLIFLDALLYDMDSWQVLAALKADPMLASIPVVMISIDGKRLRGLALGIADCIVAPHSSGLPLPNLRWLPPPKSSTDYTLIVEGDPAVGNQIQTALTAADRRVVVARSGSEALTAITVRHPAAVMLDLLLPDTDGLQLIAILHERPGSVMCPVIILIPAELSSAECAQLRSSARRILDRCDHTLDELRQQLDHYLKLYSHP